MIIVKTFGMVYKIILANMFGGVGTGLFNAAYALYNPLFMLATAGFPYCYFKNGFRKCCKRQI